MKILRIFTKVIEIIRYAIEIKKKTWVGTLFEGVEGFLFKFRIFLIVKATLKII
jgi:hypothetical protein